MTPDKAIGYILKLEIGNTFVGIINFFAVSYFLERFAWEWILGTICAAYTSGYVWWTINTIRNRREYWEAYDDFDSGRKTFAEVYPILTKHLPKGEILIQSGRKS